MPNQGEGSLVTTSHGLDIAVTSVFPYCYGYRRGVEMTPPKSLLTQLSSPCYHQVSIWFPPRDIPGVVHRRGAPKSLLVRVTSNATVYVSSLSSCGLSEQLMPWRNVNVKEVVCRKPAFLS